MKEETMDLLYMRPNQELRAALEAIGAKVEDVSDYIHEERVAVYYQKSRQKEYYAILDKAGLLDNSLSAQLA